MFIAEIKLYAGLKCPHNFLPCDGSYVDMADYPDLYAAIGSAYGPTIGNTFKLPDLRSRLPIGVGSGGPFTARTLGESVGSEEVVLTPDNLPTHHHEMIISTDPADQTIFEGRMIGDGKHFLPTTISAQRTAPMTELTIGNTGSGDGHNNIMPNIALNYIIRCIGNYPM